jgi:hypothetical protein
MEGSQKKKNAAVMGEFTVTGLLDSVNVPTSPAWIVARRHYHLFMQ